MHDGHSAHVHPHEHGHDAHAHNPEDTTRTAALLGYTLTHSEQHAEELDDLIRKLRRAGFTASADAAAAAAAALRSGNEKLSEALRLLKKEVG
ncbi:MAG: cobalt transporter [Clostridiales Family XIII bacterium]|jgi:hypothetical protein|nr:cobalt transporter [Clostridiales Family XIII bacterium]